MEIKFSSSKLMIRATGKEEIELLQEFNFCVTLYHKTKRLSDDYIATAKVQLLEGTTKKNILETLLADFAGVEIDDPHGIDDDIPF